MPRDVSGRALVQALERIGYERVRQAGSHMRLRHVADSTHHLTVPMHDPIPVGTLTGIVGDVAAHLGLSRDELIALLFG